MKKLTLILMLIVSLSFAQDVQIHGFISQGAIVSTEYNYLASNSKNLSVDFQEIGINFQSEVSDNLRIGMQLLSRDIGLYGEGRVTIDWAYGDYYINDALQVAFGRVKNPLGFYTAIQDFDFLRTWAVLPSALYDLGLRTVNSTVDGFQVHGNIDTDIAGNIDYTLTYGNMKLGKQSDIAAYVGQILEDPVQSATANFIGGANLLYNTPVTGLRLNGSVSITDKFAFDPLQQSVDLSQMGMGTLTFNYHIESDILQYYAGAQYSTGPLQLTGEYTYGKRDVTTYSSGLDQATLELLGMGGKNNSEDTYFGAYLGATYKLNQNIGVGGYYQTYTRDNDLDDDDPTKVTNDLALSLAYYIGYNMIIKLEGHYVNGLGVLSVQMNDPITADSEENWMYGVAKVSYNF